MITAVIHGQFVTPPRSIATPETAAIVAEIAERLTELEERRALAAHDLVRRLSAIGDISPRMFRCVVSMLHGNTLPVVESFAVQAHRRHGGDKQKLHYEWHSELSRVRTVFPDIAAILEQLRAQADNHEMGTHVALCADAEQNT